MKKVIIQWQDQFGNWQHYTTMHHQPSAYKTAQNRASQQNKRYRLVDDGDWSSNRLNDMIILFKFGKLPPEKSNKGNRMLAGLTCSFRNYKN